MTRGILQLDGAKISVSAERRFDAERDLHDAVAAHPEVLRSEDLGLGPLVSLGTELDFGAGPLDLLAADPQGRIVIVEFKRGTENPDVRKVVAQVPDYGARLWRTSYDDVGRRCAGTDGPAAPDLSAIAADGCALLDVPFDPDAFRAGVEAVLDSGEFVFLYVARDLDERTRRIMTYLAEGPRMKFFAVEVDYFRAGDGPSAVLVPRTAFVPSWVAEPSPGRDLRRLRLRPRPRISIGSSRSWTRSPLSADSWQRPARPAGTTSFARDPKEPSTRLASGSIPPAKRSSTCASSASLGQRSR